MIFFDLDGTLLESNGLWIEIDRQFLQDRGITTVPDDYIEFVTSHVAPRAAQYTKERFNLPESAQEILAEWQEMASHAYSHQLPLKKGAKALLESLKEQGTPCCLLTACLPELCHGALHNHGISAYFKSIHTAIELGIDKRDKALFPLVAQLHSRKPEECILIDDAIDYCIAAKEAGFTVIGCLDPNTRQENRELSQVCDLYVEDLTQISAKMLADKLKELEGAKPVGAV